MEVMGTKRRASGLSQTLLGLLCALLLLLPVQASATVEVVTTLPSLAALVREVGGAQVSVQSLLGPATDPHFADAKPSLVVTLSRADLMVVNGLELEVGWLPPVLRQSRNSRIQVAAAGYLDASLTVRKLEVPRGAVDRAQGDVHPGGNPHFLYDPRAGASVARAIGEKLAVIDPTQAAGYRQRAATLAASLERFATEERARFATLAAAHRTVVPFHRSLAYLCDWLGLSTPIDVEPRPGVSPDPAHVAKVLAQLRRLPKPVVLQERYYPTSTTQVLAKLAPAKLVVIAGGADDQKRQTYLESVRETSKRIYDALAL